MSIGKSKKVLGKSTFEKISARMAVLSQLTGKSGNKLGLEAGLGNATVNDWSDNHIENPTRAVEDFLEHHSISESWWKTGDGDVFITPAQKPTDNKEKMDSVSALREILEEGTEYRLIPKTILDGEYRIMPKKELDKYEKQFDKIDERTKIALSAKDEVIQMKDELLKDRERILKEREERILSLEKQLLSLSQKA